jgi:hypothetical protein
MGRTKWIWWGVALFAATWGLSRACSAARPAGAPGRPAADEALECQARRTAGVAAAHDLAAWEAESSRMRDA